MKIETPISVGELLDKISILEIKSEKVKDNNKLVNINLELTILRNVADQSLGDYENLERRISELKLINSELWDIEDKIRIEEKNKNFDDDFIFLARSVYITNDKRFDVKNKINNEFGSIIKEEKSYQKY